jgi:hypothetical protein
MRQGFAMGDIAPATPHQPFDRNDGVFGVERAMLFRGATDLDPPIGKIANDGRQQGMSLNIIEHDAHAAADGCHQRVGGSQIDTDGKTMLVRSRGLSRLDDL